MDLLLKGAAQLGLTLTPEQVDQFQCYYEELIAWNRKMNLTAITELDEVQIKHFLDSLTTSLVVGDRRWVPGGSPEDTVSRNPPDHARFGGQEEHFSGAPCT